MELFFVNSLEKKGKKKVSLFVCLVFCVYV
jgi:hypothetical protein